MYYLKGGFGSNLGLRPAHAAPKTFLGDDDHPGLSDLNNAAGIDWLAAAA